MEGGSFLKETTQAKVNNADTWNICAVLNQDVFLLDVPVKNVLIFQVLGRID